MEFYISRHAENERERRGIPREFLESDLAPTRLPASDSNRAA